MQLFCCHCPGQALMQIFKLICLVFRAGDQNSGILRGTQLPKKMIAWAFKKLELHLIVNSRLLSGLWTAVWNQFRHRATYASRMVSARFVGLLSSSGGLSNRKLKQPVWVCRLPGKNAKSQYPCWEVKKKQRTTTKSPRELPWNLFLSYSVFLWCGWTPACSCLVGSSAAWRLLVRSGGACTSRVEGEGTLLPLSSAIAERWA